MPEPRIVSSGAAAASPRHIYLGIGATKRGWAWADSISVVLTRALSVEAMLPGSGRPPAEVDIDAGLVRCLLAAQFPRWTDLPLRAASSAGWDNEIYRLGTDLAVRLPRCRIGAEQVTRQHRWLPVLAKRLPLAIPAVAGQGVPGEGYPWPWTITSWLPGQMAARCRGLDLTAAAVRLAGFIAALRAVDPAGGPASEFRHNLASRERLVTGVIDFGLLAVGDPAVDLMAAWTFLPGPARHAFRRALPADEATWERGRGWALELGIRCAAYATGNPLLSEIGKYTISQVLSELDGPACRGPG